VSANTGPARSANIVLGGQTFGVSQANGCTYLLAPGHLTFAASGSPPLDVTVTTDAACAWTATANRPWITILSGGTGHGSGTIRVELRVNTDGNARQGTIAVGGETVTITQNP
jgi:hypothetical protein